jgi:hypothetical protein
MRTRSGGYHFFGSLSALGTIARHFRELSAAQST